MEPVWNGILTCDYERTRPHAGLLEWDLYTRSLISWPQVLMDCPAPYGRLRRPGIVDIPETDHRRLTDTWHTRLATMDGATDLVHRARKNQNAAMTALQAGERALPQGDLTAATTAFTEATSAFLRVNSTHIVNWLLPEQRWERLLTRLLGDRAGALTCLSALQVPTNPGHILAADPELLDAAAASRTCAAANRSTWETAAIAAAGDATTADEVRALALILGWAADSEERRKELRQRYLALADHWCQATGIDRAALTTTGLLPGTKANARPGASRPNSPNPRTEMFLLEDATDPTVHGGKAAQLSTLIAAGLPVPEGLVLPAHLTDSQITGLVDRIIAWAAGRAPYGLIVRSSALGEDGPHTSFAGLYHSQFTPTAPAPLREALALVRASAASPAVEAYAHAHGVASPAGMAILIQPALRPYAAGILAAQFLADRAPTASPDTIQVQQEIPPRWHISAVYGLAESLAGGRHTGETHRHDRPPLPGRQPDIVLPATPGELHIPPGEWIELPHPTRPSTRTKLQTSGHGLIRLYPPATYLGQPVLPTPDRDQLLHIAAICATALSLTGLDLEWAITPDGTHHVVQARPLTRPIPDPGSSVDHDDHTWQGIPAAPGQATGPALCLPGNTTATVDGAHGAVVICNDLGPDAVSILLRRPAAIASTQGGPLSHAAILARELDIPCVTALPTAITRIPEGTILTLNGLTGTLRHA